ncbi:MAG: DEAD/DEAH box helicase [Bacillota bacterium]
MPVLTQNEIIKLTEDPSTFAKGLAYYSSGRVKNVIKEKEGLFHARVQGTRLYYVTVAFKGDILTTYCDCPAFAKSPGICKHIVAVLIYLIKGKPAAEEDTDPRAQRFLDELFALAGPSPMNRERLYLEPLLYFEQDYRYPLSLALKAGPERLYKVKDLRRFLLDLSSGRAIALTPKVTVRAGLESLSPEDAALVRALLEVEAWSKAATELSPYATVENLFFRKDRLLLCGKALEMTLDALYGRTFSLIRYGIPTERQTVKEGPIPLSFALREKNDRLVLTVKIEDNPIPLTPEGNYFLYGGTIHRVPSEQAAVLHALRRVYYHRPQQPIVLPSGRTDQLLGRLVPLLARGGKVELQGALKEALAHADLTCRVYLDEEGGELVARLEFRYGEEIVFTALNEDTPAPRPVLRDLDGERRMLATLAELGFTPGAEGLFHLAEDRLPDFLASGLARLQEEAEVFCTQAVKNLRLKRPGRIRAGLGLNRADLLTFEFSIEGIDRSELPGLFAALREKKRFFRLRDGSLLSLEEPALKDLAELLAEMDLSGRDLAAAAVELPKYRAFYLENRLAEIEGVQIARNAALTRLVEAVREPGKADHPVPAGLVGVLRPYQETGFRWLATLAAHGLGGILADEMGLGKTIQVLAFLAAEKAAGRGPSLVVAPTSLLYNWEAEAKRFAPELRTVVVTGPPAERKKRLRELDGVDLVITSYPLLRRDQELYTGLEFSYCFLDEAQHIKNPQTINAHSVKAICAGAKFALTGTPIENSLAELWSIFDFVLPGYLYSRQKFTQRFEGPIVRDGNEEVVSDLARRIRPFILRRTKKDVLPELPAKIESVLWAELTTEQKKLYLLYLERTRQEVAQELASLGLAKSRLKILAALTRLRQICCHPALFVEGYRGESGKMLLLEEILEDALEAGHRVLLFSQFTSMLDLIRARLRERGIGHFYLDGSVKAAERLALVEAFNAGEGKVFLISLKAGGTGLNLTGADTVIHYDPWWNPAVEDQATDRAHRLGQENVVQVIKLITRGTIEEKVHELQQTKKALIDAVVRPGETFLEKLSEEEIRALFDL